MKHVNIWAGTTSVLCFYFAKFIKCYFKNCINKPQRLLYFHFAHLLKGILHRKSYLISRNMFYILALIVELSIDKV
jgi:hypothetical protein